MTATLPDAGADQLLDARPGHQAQDDGSTRWYNHPDTDEPYLSVTWVTGACTSKPWLGPWHAKSAATYAVDFYPRWQNTFRTDGRNAAIKEITTTAAANRDIKAEVGRYEHDVMEALFLDGPIPGIPDHLDGRIVEFDGELAVIDQAWLDVLADGFLNFVTDFQWTAVAAECTVASDEHRAAGTIDGLGRSAFWPDDLIGIDAKTGAHLGPEVLAQVAPYDAFPHLWLRNGRIVKKPTVDRWAVLHVRSSYARGYKLLTLTPEEVAAGWAWWQQCRRQVETAETVPAKFGHALYPPLPDGSQPPPMVEDLTSFAGCSRAVKPLTRAGFVWMSDLAELHRADVLAIDGVGAKTVDALAGVLAGHGLTFRPDQPAERVPAQSRKGA